MAYTSFGTRKALGRRYGVDPALQLEAERLQQEYNLAPGREARGMQASQFAQNLEQQKVRDEQTAKGGMASSVLGAGQTGLTTYMLGKQAGLWGANAGTGALTSGGYNTVAQNAAGFATPAQEAAIQTATQSGVYSPTAGGVNYVSPAMTDAAGGAGLMQSNTAANFAASGAAGGEAGPAVVAGGSTAAGGGFSSGSVAGVGTIAALVYAGLLTKDAAEKYALGGKEEAGGVKGFLAESAQHPVSSVLTPGAAFVDSGMVGKDTAFGKVVTGAHRIEESLVDPVMKILGIGGGK